MNFRTGNTVVVILTLLLGLTPVYYAGAAADPAVPADILNNEFYKESLKYLELARKSFEAGEYSTSETYAREALKYAALSDEYVASQLKVREADQTFANAKSRFDWATSIGAKTKFARQYTQASTAYTDAEKARTAQNWNDVIAQANKVLAAVAEIEDLNNQQAADAALAKAKERLDWANSIDAKTNFPAPYNRANTAYADAGKAKAAKKWGDVTAQTDRVVAAVAEIEKLKNQADAAAQKKSADAIANAKKRLDWATSIGAKTDFPTPYGRADSAYNEAGRAQAGKQYDNALEAANRVIEAVAEIEKLKAQKDADATGLAAEEEARRKAEEAARLAAEEEARRKAEEAARAEAILAAQAQREAARQEAAAAIANAKERLDWAASVGAGTDYPELYNEAASAYDEAVKAHGGENYAEASTAANRVNSTVEEIERLLRTEAERTVAAARERLDWAVSVGAEVQFPTAFFPAQDLYKEAENAMTGRNWPLAIARANEVIKALEGIRERSPLPSRYIVRTWAVERDCLWTIAGYPWVYNDPLQWPLLYNANRSRIPQETNPHLILPNMILEIPSLRGEVREGDWEPNREYEPLP